MIQLGLMFLFASARGAEPGPADRALYAWADKCPSTAMGAGLYEGEGAESVPFAGGTVLRVRTRSEGVAPTGSVTETVWMLGGGCRAVGLVEAWGKGERTHGTGFVVAKEGGAPRPDEQATLLAWAGQRGWDPARPGHAAATAAFAPPVPPEERSLGDGLAATVYRHPGRVWVTGPVPTFEAAWRPTSVAPDGATCPCWEVVRPPLPTQIVEDPAHSRWAVETPDPTREPTSAQVAIPGTPPAALARLRWAGSPPPAVAGSPADASRLSAYDPDTGASFVVRVTPAATFAWSPTGLRVGGAEVPSATLLGWLAESGSAPPPAR